MLLTMAHLRYGTHFYNIPNEDVEELKDSILETLRKGEVGVYEVTDSDGEISTLFITPGVPISIHPWDSPLG